MDLHVVGKNVRHILSTISRGRAVIKNFDAATMKQIQIFLSHTSFIFFHALACGSSSFPEFFTYYVSSRSLILVTHPQ